MVTRLRAFGRSARSRRFRRLNLDRHCFYLNLTTVLIFRPQIELFLQLLWEQNIVISVAVCLSVCLSIRGNSGTIHENFAKFFVRVTYGHGSVILWRRCNILCTSGSFCAWMTSCYGFMTLYRSSIAAVFSRLTPLLCGFGSVLS